MSIDAITPNVNTTSFQGEGKKSGSAAFPITLGLLGAGTGYFLGQPINAKKVLTQDKFELSEKIAKDATAGEKESVAIINEMKGLHKEADKMAASNAEKLFGKDVNEMGVNEFLEKKTDKTIKTKDELAAKLKESETKAQELAKGLETAEEGVKKAADETAKKAAEAARDTAKQALNDHTNSLESKKYLKELVDSAKDDKISKQTFIAKETESIKGSTSKMITEELGFLGKKAGRMFSAKNAAIYGVSALVGGFILKALFGGKKEA